MNKTNKHHKAKGSIKTDEHHPYFETQYMQYIQSFII